MMYIAFCCTKVKKFSKHWVCQRLSDIQELTAAFQKHIYGKEVYKILSDQGCTEVNPLGADSFWIHATDIKVHLCKPAGFQRDQDSRAHFGILQHPSQWSCLWLQNSCSLSIQNFQSDLHKLRIQNKTFFYQTDTFGGELVECLLPRPRQRQKKSNK